MSKCRSEEARVVLRRENGFCRGVFKGAGPPSRCSSLVAAAVVFKAARSPLTSLVLVAGRSVPIGAYGEGSTWEGLRPSRILTIL